MPQVGFCWTSDLAQTEIKARTEDGRPFFWLGDTGWRLIHSRTRAECSYYLHSRARQGFTVVQVMVLAEDDGVTQPNALGQRPFIENGPRDFCNPPLGPDWVLVLDDSASGYSPPGLKAIGY